MAKRGRPPRNGIARVAVTYRFTADTVKALQQGARKKKISQTAYVENAILDHLRRDGISKPEPSPSMSTFAGE